MGAQIPNMATSQQNEGHQPCSIFLIGMMASGKSTIGKHLARKLGWPFFDVDREIESRTGVPVSMIFEKEGEPGFRARETRMMAELTDKRGVVVAMGGGAPMFEVNRKLLKRGLVVELRTSVSDILERTSRDTTRPLLQAEDRAKRIRDLLLERGPVYEAVGDVHIATTRSNPDRIVAKILDLPEVQAVIARAGRMQKEQSS